MYILMVSCWGPTQWPPGNGQGLTGDSEELALGASLSFLWSRLILEATLKDRTETSQVDGQSGMITSMTGYLI